jgi:uncharacterized protein YdhG (YjbR/CyaY superfamily)
MYNTWKQMVQFSDEHECSIEDIHTMLSQTILKQVKVTASQAKKFDAMSIPKQLCVYK